MFVCDSDVFLRVDIFTHQPPLLRCYLISTFLNWCLIQLLKRDESIIIHIDVVKIIDQLLIRRLASAGLSLWVCVVQFFVCFDISFKKLCLREESSHSKWAIGKWETYAFIGRRTILLSNLKMYRSKKVPSLNPPFFTKVKVWNMFQKTVPHVKYLYLWSNGCFDQYLKRESF